MSKKILHFKMEKDYMKNVDMSLFNNLATDLGDDWAVVLSSSDLSVSENGKDFFSFDTGEISKEELVELIKGD